MKILILATSLVLSLITGCSRDSGSSSIGKSVSDRTEFTDPWDAYAPLMVAPGAVISVSVSSEFSQQQDVLVDLLDDNGWYANARITVEPGQQWNQVTMQLPTEIKDPHSAYLAVKVLPVGASWEHYLAEKVIPLRWPVETLISKKLYYSGKLHSWNYPFVSPVGNHGRSTVTVGLAADTDPYLVGPFQGSYAIQSFADTYGIFKTNYGLNLETGEVYMTSINASHEPVTIDTTRLNPPKTKEEMSAYIEILNGLMQAVHYNASFNQGVEWPELQEADDYLGQVSATLYRQFGERLGLYYESSQKMRLFTGIDNAIGITYGAAEPRDVLIDLLVNDRWVTGMRTPIKQGSGRIMPQLRIPDSLPPLTQAVLTIKIVPAGQPWTEKTAEINVPVVIIGPNHLDWVFTLGIDKVKAGEEIVVKGSFSGNQVLDVRTDLIDSQGQWLVGEQVTGVLTYEGDLENTYNFEAKFKVPQNAKSGERLTLFTKLLPVGGDWTQALDENAIVLTVE